MLGWCPLSEGNVVGFRIYFDGKGVLGSEFSRLPREDVSKVFKDKGDQKIINKILDVAFAAFEDLHDKIEIELDALNHGASEQS